MKALLFIFGFTLGFAAGFLTMLYIVMAINGPIH